MDKKFWDKQTMGEQFQAGEDIAHDSPVLRLEHNGETYEVAAWLTKSGHIHLKLRVESGIGKEEIIGKIKDDEYEKRGTTIKLQPENLPIVPEGNYFPELVHDNEHYPVHDTMERLKRRGLIKAV